MGDVVVEQFGVVRVPGEEPGDVLGQRVVTRGAAEVAPDVTGIRFTELGELDADFGNAPVLLATAMDGRCLDRAGSQLVVPSDRCGARYISAITSVWVGACAVPAEPVPQG